MRVEIPKEVIESWGLEQGQIDGVRQQVFGQLEIIAATKEIGFQKMTRILVALNHQEKISYSTLVNYLIILTALQYSPGGVEVCYLDEENQHNELANMEMLKTGSGPEWKVFETIESYDRFYVKVRATNDTIASHNNFLKTLTYYGEGDKHLKTMEAEILVQISPHQVRPLPFFCASVEGDTGSDPSPPIYNCNRKYAIRKPTDFVLPSFSIMAACLKHQGYQASFPRILFQKFPPEEIFSGLVNHVRSINFPPLYEESVSNLFNGLVHGIKSCWFGVMLHDLYFHYPMESRSTREVQELRVEMVRVIRSFVSDGAALLTQFLWKTCIDFEHTIPGVISMSEFIGWCLPQVKANKTVEALAAAPFFEVAVLLVLIGEKFKTVEEVDKLFSTSSRQTTPSEFSSLPGQIVKIVKKLEFVFCDDVNSIAASRIIGAAYLSICLRKAVLDQRKIWQATNGRVEGGITFSDAENELYRIMHELDGSKKIDGSILLACLKINKNAETKVLEVCVSTIPTDNLFVSEVRAEEPTDVLPRVTAAPNGSGMFARNILSSTAPQRGGVMKSGFSAQQ